MQNKNKIEEKLTIKQEIAVLLLITSFLVFITTIGYSIYQSIFLERTIILSENEITKYLVCLFGSLAMIAASLSYLKKSR